ncbi:hypothetical protein DPMN_172439 [Dreissena polymorpha]|uniref:Uncharacterized protein n=1 Tax=Dreissena polymorpha TaxID=45954 RepID=A0A9D4E3N0_DREPO|nr:hypothetical protein DPMN_172439 [Dreissena polymorpha]
MPSLLGEGFHLQVTVTQMMGLCKHVFQNTVKGQQVIGFDVWSGDESHSVSPEGQSGALHLAALYVQEGLIDILS